MDRPELLEVTFNLGFTGAVQIHSRILRLKQALFPWRCTLSFTPETPEEMEMLWDAQHPDGEHVYMEVDEEGNIDPDSVTDEAPYGDDGE